MAELPVTGTQPNSKYVNASGVKDGHVPPDTVAGGRLVSVACGSQPAVVPQVKRAPGSEMDSPLLQYLSRHHRWVASSIDNAPR